MNEIIVKPVSKTLDRVYINSVSVNLGTSAIIGVSVFGEEVGYSKQLIMSGEAYTQWGDNDTYLENWVLAQLGLERA